MTVTTAKEFMQVIAKHYEKCKGIYLHTMYNIPFKLIDGGTATLKGLPEDAEERQGVAIMHAISKANKEVIRGHMHYCVKEAFESGNEENTVVEDILPEVYEKFRMMMAIEKFVSRGYMEWDKTQKDEDGFPAIKIIVPPNEWNMSEEA